jgi:hypothetical protein
MSSGIDVQGFSVEIERSILAVVIGIVESYDMDPRGSQFGRRALCDIVQQCTIDESCDGELGLWISLGVTLWYSGKLRLGGLARW